MADRGEFEYANPEAAYLQIISDAVNEYETSLVSRQRVDATPMLDLFLEEYPSERLEKVKDLLPRMNIPLVLLHHEWIEKESDQPAEEQEDRVLSIYEFVKEKLDHWTGIQKNRTHGQPAGRKTDSARELIIWSAELWFFQHLEGAKDVDIKAWICKEGTEKLFRQYFSPIDSNAPRFTIITETNACALLRQLIKSGRVENKLKDFLKRWQNIRNLTADTSMSKDMASIYDRISEKFYVVPSSPDMKMYGMHFYLTNLVRVNIEGKEISVDEVTKHATEEATQMRNAMERCKFEVIEPPVGVFNPEKGTFKSLLPWLLQKLREIKDRCSTLFISFSLHGYQGHIVDSEAHYRTIEEILREINKLDELRKIPKVVVIQACQNLPQQGWENHYNGISDSLKKFVEEECNHLRLLMPVEQGEIYRCDCGQSYLNYFAQAMDQVQTMDMVHTSAQRDADKASKTQIQSSDSRDVLLSTSVNTTPVGESSEGYDHSAESGKEGKEDGYVDLK